MISHGLNILVAVAFALAGVVFPCGNCAAGSAADAPCQGSGSNRAFSPCLAGVSHADGESHHYCVRSAASTGSAKDRTSSASEPGHDHGLTTNVFPAPKYVPAAKKGAGLSHAVASGGGVFLVLDGASIPIALHHLLF